MPRLSSAAGQEGATVAVSGVFSQASVATDCREKVQSLNSANGQASFKRPSIEDKALEGPPASIPKMQPCANEDEDFAAAAEAHAKRGSKLLIYGHVKRQKQDVGDAAVDVIADRTDRDMTKPPPKVTSGPLQPSSPLPPPLPKASLLDANRQSLARQRSKSATKVDDDSDWEQLLEINDEPWVP
ncbi:hypothetical protein BZG36_02339 [Bifiguratus adelaidae]|uniref:Uncharacterized protein n=1 Tax=Bifiguratus adelaidae TaxID=1938954 RepID=A0A261Y2K2_9FUNG|nr:hypothetical protein BZG36_02339 [Bifiguratus adelaidae]